ncbi:hypothetical protein BDW22DRAFT_1341396 [Trametopsis cervina]|nr:hypothetical protein BDW22DRAFT_1341396 [Trametopsis cervina]
MFLRPAHRAPLSPLLSSPPSSSPPSSSPPLELSSILQLLSCLSISALRRVGGDKVHHSDPKPLDEPLPAWALVFEDELSAPNDAYIAWLSRGDWWNDENACGEPGADGKKLDTGDDGGEL